MKVTENELLDRLLHHCSVININGPSYRLKDQLQHMTIAGGVINPTTVDIDNLLLIVTVEGETYTLGTYPTEEMTEEKPYHLPAGGRALFIDPLISKSKQGIALDPKYIGANVVVEICSITVDGEATQFTYNREKNAFEKTTVE